MSYQTTKKRRVILVTDGDMLAKGAVEVAARNIGGRCISASAGNPTPISGEQMVNFIKQAKNDPVVVMVDDRGSRYKGKGECVLEHVARHPDVEVIGVLAVASNTICEEGTKVDYSLTRNGNVIEGQVDKEGNKISNQSFIMGDTVDVLNELKEKVPFVIGIGDIGKMDGKDNPHKGAGVTTKALEIIMDHYRNQMGGYDI